MASRIVHTLALLALLAAILLPVSPAPTYTPAMPLNFRWTGRAETELIATTRLRCYGAKAGELSSFIEGVTHDRFADGDVVLAERDGAAVGTATSLSFSMHVRGTALPCQGVAWVGTTRADRRRKIDGRGIASGVMHALLDKARERGAVLSALMPFRASFYEHFGYGVVERRNVWNIPVATLPRADAPGWRHEESSDTARLTTLYYNHARAGQAQIETDAVGLAYWRRRDLDRGFRFVDAAPDGTLEAACTVITDRVGTATVATIAHPVWLNDDAFVRLLGFLSTLKDQYGAVSIALPADEPLHWRLSERQLPHRPVDHPAAKCEQITRMQVRVLDHVRLAAVLRGTPGLRGSRVIAIRETEGHVVRLRFEFYDGRVSAAPTTDTADIELSDVTWAAVALGELKSSDAHRLGLLKADDFKLVPLLDGLALGPVPFCSDYF